MSIISSEQFDKNTIRKLIFLAIHIKKNPSLYKKSLEDKIMVNLFFEPSTRTSASFQASMLRLGGKTIQLDPSFSSMKKNESLSDTIKVMEQYSDVIVVRHPKQHVLDNIKTNSLLINAGDGDNEHPTQGLLDLLTIYYHNSSKYINFDNLNITIVGDLKYGRTVHSLVNYLLKYENIVFNFVSPKELQLPNYLKKKFIKSSCKYYEDCHYSRFINDTDVLYMTRIQKERLKNEDYETILKYNLKVEELKKVKQNFIILHPLPRVDEISLEVDSHYSSKYFSQVKLGMYMRMAILFRYLKKSWVQL